MQKDPDALMQSGAVRMLQQKLDQVQDELTGTTTCLFHVVKAVGTNSFTQPAQERVYVAAKVSENADLRKSSAESDKKSRKQSSEYQDMKDELDTLRANVTKANEDLKKAQATASSAMKEARVAVTNELSQVWSTPYYCTGLSGTGGAEVTYLVATLLYFWCCS